VLRLLRLRLTLTRRSSKSFVHPLLVLRVLRVV
jgi:hypothetical protein